VPKRNIVTIVILAFVIIPVGVGIFLLKNSIFEKKGSSTPTGFQFMGELSLTSPAFANNGMIPSKYTCDGENVNPPLDIHGTPDTAKSLVLIVDDPDAPAGTWDHWILLGISPATHHIEENNIPRGVIQGITDFGKNEYGGPCPPSGTHHYYFKFYALDSELTLDPSSKKEDVENAMEGHILAQTVLIGLYQRK